MNGFIPHLVHDPGEIPRLGDPLVDEYLRFVAARARHNTLLAQTFDLKVFFTIVGKTPTQVGTSDVFEFIQAPTATPNGNVVRLADGESGLAASTIKRRLASIAGLFTYLGERGLIDNSPVPRGLTTRAVRSQIRGVPLIRAPRRLPRILGPDEANALLGALRSERDRAMILLMLFGGLRRCEVLGLRMADVRPGERRVFVSAGKGGHQRIVPVTSAFFTSLGSYLDGERPPGAATDHVFLVLKRPRRGSPLTAAGLDEILSGARIRAGLPHATCHELRHTCFTRLREPNAASIPHCHRGRAVGRNSTSQNLRQNPRHRWSLRRDHSD
ncbi:tyrosine-type recombinase/integrase [Rhodococcus sp. NPDC059968]|uniref:tyrosine-type recombinase/integrase n=1 Tax=Rhodococcus sp. NPDC059968 TaxID=3347017 RepID=UPI00366D6A33